MTARHDATLPQAPRMLVVDDDRRRASSLAQWLCGQGGHAIAAGSAAAAVRVIGRGGIELCIVDAGLPDDGAAAVAAAIRGAVPTGGIVAILPGELRGATSSPIWPTRQWRNSRTMPTCSRRSPPRGVRAVAA